MGLYLSRPMRAVTPTLPTVTRALSAVSSTLAASACVAGGRKPAVEKSSCLASSSPVAAPLKARLKVPFRLLSARSTTCCTSYTSATVLELALRPTARVGVVIPSAPIA